MKGWVFHRFTLALLLPAVALGCASCAVKERGRVQQAPGAAGRLVRPSPQGETPPEVRPSLYGDKNGYFSFVPPDGWTRKDYPGDPRSKVQFDCPAAEGVLIRLIAEAAQPGVSSDNIVDATRNRADEARARLGPGTKTEVSKGTFGGFTAALVRSSLAGQMEQELTIFVAGNVLFNIAYSAPTTAMLEEYRDVVKDSLDTLVVGKQVSVTAGGDQAREHFVARHLRLAQMFAKAGDFENATKSLEDGLERYPDDARLKQALELVRDKNLIPENLGPRGPGN